MYFSSKILLSEINPCIYGQMIFDKVPRPEVNGDETVCSTNSSGKLYYLHAKN